MKFNRSPDFFQYGANRSFLNLRYRRDCRLNRLETCISLPKTNSEKERLVEIKYKALFGW